MDLIALAVLPVIGALIGWLTNRMAIQLLFRPRNPVNLFGLRFQGLIPRRQQEIALRVAALVEKELFNQHLIRSEIESIDLQPYIEPVAKRLVYERISPKISEIPLLGSFINDKVLANLHRMALEALKAEALPLLKQVAAETEKKIAVEKIVEERMQALDLDQLETLIRNLARTEFRAIEILGAVVGFLVGLLQAAVLFGTQLL